MRQRKTLNTIDMMKLSHVILLLFVPTVYADRPIAVEPKPPRLDEPSRPWVDNSGAKAVVGVLIGRSANGRFIIERADGRRFRVRPEQLSVADRVYAIEATEPRIDTDAQVRLGSITKIMDGDTLKLSTIKGASLTIRLNGVDAPEKAQQFGTESRAWLEQFVGENVRIEFSEQDRYGRILGDVYAGPRWLNHELVAAGLGYWYEKYSDDERLATAQRTARTGRLGVWSTDKRILPGDWRNGVRDATAVPVNAPSIRETDETVFVTRSGTHYHTKQCRYAKHGTEIPLSRAVSAYEPCAVCRPRFPESVRAIPAAPEGLRNLVTPQ